jgi:hypothetical protein
MILSDWAILLRKRTQARTNAQVENAAVQQKCRQPELSAAALTTWKALAPTLGRMPGEQKAPDARLRPKGHAMKTQIVTLGLLIGAASFSGAAEAGTAVCADRTVIVGRLAAEYGETRQAIGLASASQVVEIFASEETGSWTITVTRPDGTTCLMAAGQHFEELEEEITPAASGDPA